jgi:hypothetical protein
MLSREHQGPRAVLNALDRLATGYGSDCDRVRQDLSIAEAQLRDYKSRLGKPFTLENYLTELTGLRDLLKAGLSGAAHESDEKKGLSISDIAGKIKALKATHSVEATPQRVRQKHSTAEEPITARIRRRAESMTSSGSATEPDAIPVAGITPQPPTTFQERIIHERQRKDDGQSPP